MGAMETEVTTDVKVRIRRTSYEEITKAARIYGRSIPVQVEYMIAEYMDKRPNIGRRQEAARARREAKNDQLAP